MTWVYLLLSFVLGSQAVLVYLIGKMLFSFQRLNLLLDLYEKDGDQDG